MEPSSSVKMALKEHATLIEEGHRRLKEFKFTKFDKLQLSKMFETNDEERKTKGLEIGSDLGQRILGPEYQILYRKMQYKNTKLLAQVSFEQFCLYMNTVSAKDVEFHLEIQEKIIKLATEFI